MTSIDFAAPEQNIAQFGLGEGMSVADLGAGSGHYTLAAAKKVGESGHVYAIEVQKDLLTRIKNLAKTERAHNVEVIWGDVETKGGTKLKDDSLDAVIISNILFQVESKAGLIEEAFRILKPKGRALIIDWSDSYGGMGPQADDIVSPEQARRVCEEVGFSFEKELSVGANHFGFIVKKS